jgi:hypothetical protein
MKRTNAAKEKCDVKPPKFPLNHTSPEIMVDNIADSTGDIQPREPLLEPIKEYSQPISKGKVERAILSK